MDGVGQEVGDGPAMITGVISPVYACLNFRMLNQRMTWNWQPLGCPPPLIYYTTYYSQIRTMVT